MATKVKSITSPRTTSKLRAKPLNSEEKKRAISGVTKMPYNGKPASVSKMPYKGEELTLTKLRRK